MRSNLPYSRRRASEPLGIWGSCGVPLRGSSNRGLGRAGSLMLMISGILWVRVTNFGECQDSRCWLVGFKVDKIWGIRFGASSLELTVPTPNPPGTYYIGY